MYQVVADKSQLLLSLGTREKYAQGFSGENIAFLGEEFLYLFWTGRGNNLYLGVKYS
jgi:hypothetical protein